MQSSLSDEYHKHETLDLKADYSFLPNYFFYIQWNISYQVSAWCFFSYLPSLQDTSCKTYWKDCWANAETQH